METDRDHNVGGTAAQRAPAAGKQPHQPNNPIVQRLASRLGLSPQDLRTQIRSGETLREIAATQGVHFSDVQSALTAAAAAAVSSGQLSQQHSQALLSLVADPTFGSTVQSTHQLLRAVHGHFAPEAG